MGIENMRRWPMYIVFAVCILLTLSLFNSWGLETELRSRIAEISSQLQECADQQTKCMQDSLSLLEQKDGYVRKATDFDRENKRLRQDIQSNKEDALKAVKKFNSTQVDLEICKTELKSSDNLRLTQDATLETLRLEKETLATQLEVRNQKIGELERQIDKLKIALTTKSSQSPSSPLKVSPAAAPPKQSPSLNVVNNVKPPINEPILENNDAKEDLEDTMINDDNGFDPQLNN